MKENTQNHRVGFHSIEAIIKTNPHKIKKLNKKLLINISRKLFSKGINKALEKINSTYERSVSLGRISANEKEEF